MNFQDLIDLADNSLSSNGDKYADWILVPGFGQVNVTRGDGQTYGNSGITGLQLHDPTRDGQGLGGGFYLTPNDDGSIGKTAYDYKSGFWDYALPALAAAVTGGGLSGGLDSLLTSGSGAAAAGTEGMSLAEALSTYAPEFSSEVAAAGMADAPFAAGLADAAGELSLADVMAETNPNWWEEVTANGMGDPGLSSDLFQIPVDGIDQLPNEAEKLLRQQTLAQNGADLLSTALPTIDLSSSLIPDALKSLATPSNMAKLAGALAGGGGQRVGGGSSGVGGNSGLASALMNTTPGIAASAPAQQNSSMSLPMQIGDYKQPQFDYTDFMAIPAGVQAKPLESQSDIAKLAKALQEQKWLG